MKRFRFRFAALARLADQNRDDARMKVAEAQQALEMLQQRVAVLDETRMALRSERSGSLVGQVSIDRLLHHGRYDLQIEIEHRELVGQCQQIQAEIDRRRGRLMLAEQECRKFQRLEEAALEKHQQEQRKQEQAEMDELAGRRLPHITPGEVE